MWDYHGFARVAKLISDRSDAKYIFKDWQAGSLRAVEELSVGTYVLALPRVERDLRWCPKVTLDATEHARFTYIHPQVIQPVATQLVYSDCAWAPLYRYAVEPSEVPCHRAAH